MDRPLKKLTGIGLIILLGFLFYCQLIKGNYYREESRKNYIRLIPQPAPRGNIYDRKGRLLVRNDFVFEVGIMPSLKKNDEIISRAAEALGASAGSLKSNLKKNIIAPFIPAQIYVTSDKEKIIALEDKNLPGIIVRRRFKREILYPYILSHILGYTRKLQRKSLYLLKYGYKINESVGYTGIEQYYNDYLRGSPGGEQVEVDANGHIVNYLSRKSSVKGRDIILTIDKDLQQAAFDSFRGQIGCIILMDAETGEILTLANSPSFAVKDLFNKQKAGRIIRNKTNPLFNRAVQGEYPLGSVFKTVVSLAGLAEGRISPKDKFLCLGKMRIGDRDYLCEKAHQWQDLEQGLYHSCNIYFYNVGLKLGPVLLHKYAVKLGLGAKTKIDLPYEKAGFVPSVAWKKKFLHQKWYPGDTANLSIGQGYLLATPIQVAKLISFFANKGALAWPHIAKYIGNIPVVRPKEVLAIPSKYINEVNRGLRAVIANPEGTAHILNSLPFKISGKTGTAQNPHGRAHGWFAGFFSYKNKKYVIVVFTEHSGSSYYSCRVAYNFLSKIKDLL